MKKRALRRHQQWVAKLRHVRIVWRSSDWAWTGTPFRVAAEPHDPLRPWARYWTRPWQQVSRCTMNGEPKEWQYEFNLRPSRSRQNRLVREIERGMDPDVLGCWPDYRKPHIYYW